MEHSPKGPIDSITACEQYKILSYLILILSGAHQHTNRILFSTKKAPINGERNYDSTVVLCCVEEFFNESNEKGGMKHLL